MASAVFKGYLLKASATGTIFPNMYIELGTWQSTPNQREYQKAYRDDNTRNLTLVEASGQKTAFAFKIRDGLHLKDVEHIRDWFYNAEIKHSQRKITVEFWDDDLLKYRTITCYQVNPKFEIQRVTKDDIIYKGRTIELVEF